MQYIFSLLPVLACPVGMGLMMWFMMRGNKNQATREVDQAPASVHRESVEVASETPQRASLLKTIGSCLNMCLNWKVAAGLAVLGVIVWVVAPRSILVVLPLLLVAACPLSMLFMMRGMRGGQCQAPAGGPTHDVQLPELQSRLLSVQAEQEAIASQIAELEGTRIPALPDGELVTYTVSQRNGSRAAPKNAPKW